MNLLVRKSLFGFVLVLPFFVPVSPCRGENLSDLFEKARVTLLNRPEQARDFALPNIKGEPVRLKNLRGKVVFLNVWTTWCAPCRHEMPSIERLYHHFQNRDLIVLAVSVDLADIGVVKAFLERQKLTFTVLHDPRGDIMDWFRVRLIPVTYLIDRSGKIIGKAVGPRDWSQACMIRLFEELLKGPEKKP